MDFDQVMADWNLFLLGLLLIPLLLPVLVVVEGVLDLVAAAHHNILLTNLLL